MKTYKLKEPKSKQDYKGAPDHAPDLPLPVGIDLHPDMFDAIELRQGKQASKAEVTRRFREIAVADIVSWAKEQLDSEKNLLIIEATSNSFDTVAQLTDAGFSCVIVDSTQTEKVSEAFIDNDQLAAERIARCYLTGFAKTVWVPDDQTIERRELLHAYQNAVTAHVRATNELKSFLTTKNIRPGQRNLNLAKNQAWIYQRFEKVEKDISPLRKDILDQLIETLNYTKQTRDKFYRAISQQMLEHSDMLKCLRVVGIGMINAFAIVAIVGDVRRFATANKLVSYLGLNPGRKKSGTGIDIKKGTGKRGRRDMRSLLIQAAQVVLNRSAHSNNKLGKWGFKLYMRTGNRNIAVVAIARKLAVSLYYILSGREIDLAEQEKGMERKFRQLSVEIGEAGRKALGLPEKTGELVKHLFEKIGWQAEVAPTATPSQS